MALSAEFGSWTIDGVTLEYIRQVSPLVPQASLLGRIVTFTADGTIPGLTYQWVRNGHAIVDGVTGTGSTIAGTQDSVLTINNLTLADLGEYRYYAYKSGGREESNVAILRRCVADFDDGSGNGTPDGGVTIDDLLYYLAIFEEGLLAADVDNGSLTGDPDGGVSIDDLLYYLLSFESGC